MSLSIKKFLNTFLVCKDDKKIKPLDSNNKLEFKVLMKVNICLF